MVLLECSKYMLEFDCIYCLCFSYGLIFKNRIGIQDSIYNDAKRRVYGKDLAKKQF